MRQRQEVHRSSSWNEPRSKRSNSSRRSLNWMPTRTKHGRLKKNQAPLRSEATRRVALLGTFGLVAALADTVAECENDARHDEHEMDRDVPGQIAVGNVP